MLWLGVFGCTVHWDARRWIDRGWDPHGADVGADWRPSTVQ